MTWQLSDAQKTLPADPGAFSRRLSGPLEFKLAFLETTDVRQRRQMGTLGDVGWVAFFLLIET